MSIRAFFKRRTDGFRAWWRAPPTVMDRVLSSFLGGWAGLWIGAIGRIIIGPASLPELLQYSVGTAIALLAMGALFPKTMRIVAFPFAFIGAPS